jgi:predicted flavoprotein YhiN
MMCAAIARQRGRRAVLIEHSPKLGEKIRISGGGRCNFTSIHCKPENFLSRNADFCRSATLPRRFAQQWCEAMGAVRPIDQMGDKALRALAEALHDWQVKPCGTSGYAKAEVMLGGVDTNELSSRTMEAKRVAGLYFFGEVVDVTGQLGRFNFQRGRRVSPPSSASAEGVSTANVYSVVPHLGRAAGGPGTPARPDGQTDAWLTISNWMVGWARQT